MKVKTLARLLLFFLEVCRYFAESWAVLNVVYIVALRS